MPVSAHEHYLLFTSNLLQSFFIIWHHHSSWYKLGGVCFIWKIFKNRKENTSVKSYFLNKLFSPCLQLWFKKELQCRCFSVNFVNFFRNSNSVKHFFPKNCYLHYFKGKVCDSSKLVAKLLNSLMPHDNKRSYILKQTCNFYRFL